MRRVMVTVTSARLPIIILVAIALHIVWAIGLAVNPAASNATAVHALMLLTKYTDVAALILAVAAAFASVGVGWRWAWGLPARLWRVLLLLPQQCLLMISSIGAMDAMLSSSFADGVARPLWFIVVDQIPVILITLGTLTALVHIAWADDGRA